MRIPTNMIHFVFDESDIHKEGEPLTGTTGLLDPFELRNIQVIGKVLY
jgi:hypothetical protein